MDRTVRRYVDLARDVLASNVAVRLVGVDGCGAAGKTTFAARLAAVAGDAPVVHTDDFASFDEPIDWWPRLLAEVIEPLGRGERASFHPYDWVARAPSPDVMTIPPAPVVVIEGVGATRSAWRDRLVRSIWVDAPRDLRLRRGVQRDGAHMREFWTWWMAEEDRYVADEHPGEHADLCVDGDPQIAYDPATEFVALSAPR